MPWDLLIALIPVLPLAGFAFTALFGRRLQAALRQARRQPDRRWPR